MANEALAAMLTIGLLMLGIPTIIAYYIFKTEILGIIATLIIGVGVALVGFSAGVFGIVIGIGFLVFAFYFAFANRHFLFKNNLDCCLIKAGPYLGNYCCFSAAALGFLFMVAGAGAAIGTVVVVILLAI